MNNIVWLSHAWWGPPIGTHGPGSQGGSLTGKVKNRKSKSKNKDKKEEKKDKNKFSSSAENFKTTSAYSGLAVNNFEKAYDYLHKAKYGNKDRSANVQHLTNDELRRLNERIDLNRKYNELTMPKKSKGHYRAMAALAVVGGLATVTASGLTIAAGIHELKKRKLTD